MSIEQQADEVRKVKRSWKGGVIIDPFYLTPSHTIAEADELMGSGARKTDYFLPL